MTCPIIARLDTLHAKATPGEWKNGPRIDECAAVQCEHADIFVGDDDDVCNVACATFTPDEADLVCLHHNSWSAISAVLKAAEAYEAWFSGNAVNDGSARPALMQAVRALRAMEAG